MELDGDQIRITRRSKDVFTSLQFLASPPVLRKGILGTALTIRLGEHGDVTLKGAGRLDAREFSKEVKEAWVRFNLAALEKEASRLDKILAGVRSLMAPSRYPAACQIAPLLEEAPDPALSLLPQSYRILARVLPVFLPWRETLIDMADAAIASAVLA